MGSRNNAKGPNYVVEPYKTDRKCPRHNAWKKKGVCELCRLELDKIQQQNELTGGSNKQPIVIKKI